MDMSMKFVITNHAVHNRLTFYPLSKNAMIKIWDAVILILFCLDMILGLSHSGKNMDWGV